MKPSHEITRFWIEPRLGNLELLRATYTTYAFAPHTHETFAIGVTEIGAQAFTYRRRQHFIMPAGSVAVVNPGEVHTSQAADADGWTYRMLYPDPSLLERVFSQVSGRERGIPFFPSPVLLDRDLAGIIHRLHTALEDPSITQLERESRLHWALAQLVTRYADQNVTPREYRPEYVLTRKVRDYLTEHYAEDVSLDDLTHVTNVSAFHLLRTFRDVAGLPPHAYLVQVRLARAKRLLLAGLPIARVAAETGFADQSHLTKSFKRAVGVTPGHYQRNSKILQDR